MVMINMFDLIGDTDIDDPLQIALARKKAAAEAAAVIAEAEAAAAAKAASELPVEETKKEVLDVPHGGEPYQDGYGQNGRGQNGYGQNGRGQNGYGQNGYGQNWRGQNGHGRGRGRNFGSNRNVDGFYAVSEDSAQELQGKPSIRGHSDQPYHSHDGGRGRGYLNRDDGEYTGRPARRQFEHRSGFSSPHAKIKGEPAPLVKEVDKLPEQNLEENVTLEGKSLIPKETVKVDNEPSSNALNQDKQGMVNGREEKEPKVKEMTLEEYQKVLEEKRRTLVAMKKTQERKVDVDKEFESMQQLVVKKEINEFFIQLGNDKEAGKRKEDTDGDERVKKDTTDRVERIKKTVSIDEFLKLAERRRGGYRGGRGAYRGGRGDSSLISAESVKDGHRDGRGYSSLFAADSVTDARQFPALGGKEVEQQHSSAQWKKVEQQQQQHSTAQGKKVEQT